MPVRDHASLIGAPLPKVDAYSKVTGRAVYTDDMVLPRMLYGRLLRSPHPHAIIRSIDTSRALALPGVVAVITGADLPHAYGILPSSQDEHALAVDKVRYVGDPVAAVAATDPDSAEQALGLIDVAYELLPALMSIDEALARPEVKINAEARVGNIHKAVAFEFGDVAAGFAQADYVREDWFFYEGNNHVPIEAHSALAQWEPNPHDPHGGKLTLWSSTQTPHYVHRELSKVLGLPPSHVRVIVPSLGGGFGGKTDPLSHEFCAAELARRTARPVKITLTREEVFYAHRGRHPVKMWVRSGARRDGTLTALHFRSWLDGGAYGSYGVATVYYTGALQPAAYALPCYKFEGMRVFTNKPPCGPKRGHGTTQPRYALEVHLDKLAHELQIDPLELRRRNLIAPHSTTVNGLRVTSCALDECLTGVAEASGFGERAALRQAEQGQNGGGPSPLRRGMGLAASTYLCGAGRPIYWNPLPHSAVQIRLDRSGGVTVYCGATDVGQGSTSMLAYIVAEELGVTVEQIAMATADTALTPVDLGSYSSRVTFMAGNAAIAAARTLRAQLFAVAAERLGVAAERLAAAGGVIFDGEDPGRALPFVEAVQLAEARHGALVAAGSYAPPPGISADYKGAGVGPAPAYSYSACVAQVAVDIETGELLVEKLWLAHDIGQAINPLLAIGQVEGGAYMGCAEATMEQQVFRKGRHRAPSLLDYKIPTTLDTPAITSILVGERDPEGPYGAKEVGQGPLNPVIPAIANAVFDAIGVRIDETPITPEKVLKALRGAGQGRPLTVTPLGGPAAWPTRLVSWSPEQSEPAALREA
ncbi:MAG: molybdopterin-dependent oxidoreductase [Chloroflexales bacterium]|nr:molybdopterin-dependent oxidoreductase [Chloroflexales bacterium]